MTLSFDSVKDESIPEVGQMIFLEKSLIVLFNNVEASCRIVGNESKIICENVNIEYAFEY